MSENSNGRVCFENMHEADPPVTGQPVAAKSGTGDRYSVALSAALLILEDIDASPASNQPIRLAKVIGHVLDAIYAADSGQVVRNTIATKRSNYE